MAGLGGVKIAEGELLDMIEQVLAHVVLHAHPEDMAPIVDDILEQRPQQVEPQQGGADLEKRASFCCGRMLSITHCTATGKTRSSPAMAKAQLKSSRKSGR